MNEQQADTLSFGATTQQHFNKSQLDKNLQQIQNCSINAGPNQTNYFFLNINNHIG